MYKLPSEYKAYYEDYINRDVRDFEMECKIGGSLIPQSEISSISVEYDLLSGAEEYTIGNLAAAKLTAKVSSSVTVREGDKIELEIILKTQEVDKNENPINIPIPIGRFFVFNVNYTKLSKTITAYDDLYKTELEDTYNSKWEYTSTKPVSVHTILDELCEILDIEYSKDIPNEDIYRPDYVPQLVLNDEGKYVVIESSSDQVCYSMNIGQALSYIAAYLGGNFIVDADRRLKLIKIATDMTMNKVYPPTAYSSPQRGEATYRIDTMHCTFSTGTVYTLGENTSSSLTLENPFYNQSKFKEIFDYIKQIRYKPVNVRIKGDPILQLGDTIGLSPLNPKDATFVFPILRMKVNFTGGCSIDAEAVCKPEAEKSINYKGTLTSRVDKLEGNISKISEIIDNLSKSLRSLADVKESIDDMDELIDDLPTTIFTENLELFNDLLALIKRNDRRFNEEYEVVLNNRYLK
jgi:hypothetical protein